MTSCFVCATLNLGRKKSTGTEPYILKSQIPFFYCCSFLITFLSDPDFPHNLTFDPLVSMEEMTIGEDLGPIICHSDCTDCGYVWLTPVGNISGQVLMKNNMTEVDFGMYSCVVFNPSHNNGSTACRQEKSFTVFQS